MKHTRHEKLVKKFESPPAWGRGLKLEYLIGKGRIDPSPPAWGRGLKQVLTVLTRLGGKSPPAWGRGLKHNCITLFDAWECRPPRGGVD